MRQARDASRANSSGGGEIRAHCLAPGMVGSVAPQERRYTRPYRCHKTVTVTQGSVEVVRIHQQPRIGNTSTPGRCCSLLLRGTGPLCSPTHPSQVNLGNGKPAMDVLQASGPQEAHVPSCNISEQDSRSLLHPLWESYRTLRMHTALRGVMQLLAWKAG